MLNWIIPILMMLMPMQKAYASDVENIIVQAAIEQTLLNITYDSSYVAIPYPNGDISPDRGVCTDLLIRAYRKAGIDLQKLVHDDITKNFSTYPSKKIWGAHRPDTNIDHRRVFNLEVFFKRHGKSLSITKNNRDYKRGDIITWTLPGHRPHIGIATHLRSGKTGNPIIAHNIGAGPELEDMLFNFEITGHYRFIPNQSYPSLSDSTSYPPLSDSTSYPATTTLIIDQRITN